MVYKPKSFGYLYIVNDIIQSTFYKACIIFRLTYHDLEWIDTFKEVVPIALGEALQQFFIITLVYRGFANVVRIWDKLCNYFCNYLGSQMLHYAVFLSL